MEKNFTPNAFSIVVKRLAIILVFFWVLPQIALAGNNLSFLHSNFDKSINIKLPDTDVLSNKKNWMNSSESLLSDIPTSLNGPSISSFSPISGPVGTIVTISGSDFGATIEENIVFFGAVRATVITASTTQLEVEVPVGSSFRPISVTVDGLTASSRNSFIVTFPDGVALNNEIFKTQAGLSGFDGYSVATGDLDNDGKADLVIPSYTGGDLLIYRNIGEVGEDITFDTPISIVTEGGPTYVVVADFDGDGKLDIAITLFDSDEIFIYRNTSNDPGEISFDNIPIELEYPNGNWMAVGDFDNDGRPDLAVVNVIDNAVSIFRNTSSDIGNISFDAQQDIPSTSRAFSVAVADLDGDGLVDIGSIGPGPIAAKVHRNTSTGPGDISFAATQDHTVGVESYNIAFADMDGDGKPEMITTRWVGGPQVRVSLNTSIAGSISFDPFSELIAPGNQNDITVADFDGDGKPDFATVSQEGNSISIFKNTSDGVSNLSFASPVTQPVLNSPFVLTNTDFNLDGKPDLVVVSSGNGAAILKNATPFRPFITKWVTDDGNITIPTTGGGYNYTISWFNETSPGDDEGSAINQTGNFMITKLTNGHIYRIEISEDFPRIFFDFGGDSDKIQSVEQWGDIAWTSMEGAFTGCSNLVINASDAPNLSGVTNMKDMFFFASAVNDGLENWDVSNITNMQNLFYGATAFNGNIGAWNVENVTNMSFMFYEALAFNQNLNEWDVGSVTNMSSMFVGASNFDGPIGDWNTSSVTEMGEMFFGASAFNQPIGNWNMSSVVGTFTMFQNATSFNQPIGDWNMESVTNTGDMFNNATAFDQDISLWNVSNVTSMWGMFQGATAFNQNLGDWDVTNTNRASLNMSDMLDNSGMSKANYDATLIGWAAQEPLTPNVTLGAAGLTYCGGASAKLTLEAAGWTVGGEQDCLPFITTWVTDDGNITIPTAGGGGYNYNVTWTNLTNEGQGDGSINGQTENYTIEGLENGSTYQIEITGDFPSIFFNDTGDKDKILTIEQWGEISWQSMEEAFAGCSILRSNATDSPDLSGVTSTLGMFRQASGFTGDLSEWDVSQVTDMRFMFLGASSFNSDLSEWDVGNVTLMTSMFANCTSFNSDLSEWTVGQVINTVSMFNSATQFNSDLSAWDVSNVNNMSAMFQQASSFSSNLGDWNISQVNNMTAIFSLSGLTTEDYDSTLQGWAQRSDLQLNLSVGVAALTYCEGATAREILMDGFNWTFEGDEEDCPEPPASPFITIWKTDNPGSTADNQILIPRTNITGVQDFDLYWEEVGNPDNNGFEMGLTGSPTITFPNPGTYRIEILGNFKFIRFFDSGQQEKLISIEQWGEIEWEAFNAAFRGCSNLVYNATDAPDLLQVDNLSGIFQGCTNFNGDLSNWDVSSITDMSNAFSFTELFNGDISTWDVSNVTNFSAMFRSAFAFNGDIENWEPSNADNMSNMFRATEVFNRDLSRWDLNPGINLFEMFREATAFNGDISTWDVTASTIACMFQDAPLFNQDISGWNIGETTALLALFAGAESFNQDISAWDVSQVTNMQSLFDGASSFDQNLGSWEVGQVDIMNNIFSNSGLSTANYDLILQGWAALPSLQEGLTLGAEGLIFCEAADARQSLIDNFNWTFNGDLFEESCATAEEPLFSLSGNVFKENVPAQNVRVSLFQQQGNIYRNIGSRTVNEGAYLFADTPSGNYFILAEDLTGEFRSTYFGDATSWTAATELILTGDISGIDINMVARPTPIEPPANSLSAGIIRGFIETVFEEGRTLDRSRVRGAGVSIGLIRTQIRTADNQPFVEIIAFRSTDENGEFDFRGLPPEDYVVLVDIPGVPLSDNLNDYLIRIPEIANDSEYEVNIEIEAGPQGIIFRVNLPLSIVEEINDLQLYPNPTSSQLRLRPHSNLHQYNRYEIFDLRGMKRQSGSFDAHYAELGVEGLAEGIYFLRLTGEGATSKTYKFIKRN